MENCNSCDKKPTCETPCDEVSDILWKDNRVMERHSYRSIVCYPQKHEVHFNALSEEQIDQFSGSEYVLADTAVKDATLIKKDIDVVPWGGSDFKLRKTTVFVERFFNKTPCKELADRFGVKENTIVCMYAQAVDGIEKLLAAMDARREGLKATKESKFSDDQKLFLLVQVFGFNGVEAGKMFNLDYKAVHRRVKRLSDKYKKAFEKEKPVRSMYEEMTVDQIKERMVP